MQCGFVIGAAGGNRTREPLHYQGRGDPLLLCKTTTLSACCATELLHIVQKIHIVHGVLCSVLMYIRAEIGAEFMAEHILCFNFEKTVCSLQQAVFQQNVVRTLSVFRN